MSSRAVLAMSSVLSARIAGASFIAASDSTAGRLPHRDDAKSINEYIFTPPYPVIDSPKAH